MYLRNTHNGYMNDRGTNAFSIYTSVEARIKEGKEWNSLNFDDITIINKSKLRIKNLDFQDFEVRFSLNSKDVS